MRNWLGWVSVILSLALGAFISRLLFPLMMWGFMKIKTFETIAIPLAAVPLIIGLLGLRKKHARIIPLIGTALALILLVWVLALNFVRIHIQGLR